MKKSIKKIKNYLSSNFELLAATGIFICVLVLQLEFHQTIILMLEFIVIMEVMKMISDFIKKEKLRLRFIIDIFIIFLIRDVIIQTSYVKKDYDAILFLLFVIFIFFIFRILSIKFSPGVIKISKDTVVEYEDERKSKKVSEFEKKEDESREKCGGVNEDKKIDSNS